MHAYDNGARQRQEAHWLEGERAKGTIPPAASEAAEQASRDAHPSTGVLTDTVTFTVTVKTDEAQVVTKAAAVVLGEALLAIIDGACALFGAALPEGSITITPDALHPVQRAEQRAHQLLDEVDVLAEAGSVKIG